MKKRDNIIFRCTPEFKNQIKTAAAATGRDVTSYISNAIRNQIISDQAEARNKKK